MGTIIDSLYVEFGLDPKKFTEGQKKVISGLDDIEKRAKKSGANVSEGAKLMEEAFGGLQRRMLAIVGLFVGGMGVGKFTQEVTQLVSATGRLSQSLGVNLRDFGAWERVGQTVGATSESIAAGIANLRQSMARGQLSGPTPLTNFAYATHQRGQGPPVNLYRYDQASGTMAMRSVTDVMLDMARWWKAQKDKNVASEALRNAGVSEPMLNMIMLGPQELRRRLEQYRKYAPTAEQTERFQKLQKAMADASISAETLGRIIANMISPELIAAMKAFSRIVNGIIDEINRLEGQPAGTPQAPGTAGSFWDKAKHPWSRLGDWWGSHAPSWLGGGSSAAPTLKTPHPNSPVFKDYSGGGAIDRSRFAKELEQKPWLKQKIMAIAAGENLGPQANQAVLETMMNRAAMTGTSLEEQARLYGRERGGYYAGYNPSALSNARTRGMIEDNLRKVLGGSNVSNYATDNASGGLAMRDAASGRFVPMSQFHGETFFSPGPNYGGGRRGMGSYVDWRKRVAAGGVWHRGAAAFPRFDSIDGVHLIGDVRSSQVSPPGGGPARVSTTSIGDVHVHTSGATGPEIGDDLRNDLQRQHGVVIHADTGLE